MMGLFRCMYMFLFNFSILLLLNFPNCSSLATSLIEKDEFPPKEGNNDQYKRKTIVGGIISPAFRYPYMVTLQHSLTTSRGSWHVCTGSLIAPDIILSAAHCYNKTSRLPHAIIGDHDFNDPNDGGEKFDLELLSFHHTWDTRLINGDIILFKTLGGMSTKTPIRLNKDSDVPVVNQTLTVAGWGRTSPTERTNVLKEATLEYISNKACYGAIEHAHKSVICTMDLDEQLDEGICNGDSGGPLFIRGSTFSDDIQVGIVSMGVCETPHSSFPAKFTRISEYYDWIRSYICAYSVAPPSDYKCQTVSPYPSISMMPSVQPSISSSPTITKIRFTLVFRLDRFPQDVVWSVYEYYDGFVASKAEPLFSNMKGYSKDLKSDFAYDTFFLEPNKTFVIYVIDLNYDGLRDSDREGYWYLYRGKESFGNFLQSNSVLWRKGDYDFYTGYIFNSTKLEESSPPPTPHIPHNQFITVEIKFDDFPNLISWGIRSQDGQTIYHSKPRGSYLVIARQVISEIVYLPALTPLQFFVHSMGGHGLQGGSYFKVYDGHNKTLLYKTSGIFIRREYNFELDKLTSQPSSSPTTLPSLLPSKVPTIGETTLRTTSSSGFHHPLHNGVRTMIVSFTLLYYTIDYIFSR